MLIIQENFLLSVCPKFLYPAVLISQLPEPKLFHINVLEYIRSTIGVFGLTVGIYRGRSLLAD
jgi:hypothetical protein